MVRETRHLWVGNLPETAREDRIRELFKRYGRVQSVKLLPRTGSGGDKEAAAGEVTMACTVAFMDIKSASKAHNADLKIDDRTLNTEYYEPAAIPSTATAAPQPPAPSPYCASPAAARFPNGHGADDHATFDRFYSPESAPGEAAGGTPSSGRRASSRGERDREREKERDRGRDRDRSYRCGGAAYDRHGRPAGGGTPAPATPTGASGSAASPAAPATPTAAGGTTTTGWPYESPRYNSSSSSTPLAPQPETGYPSSDSTDRKPRSKPKSRSGSRSASPSGSASSRSPSRSRSQSSSSSSSSSTSRATSSTGSRKSRRRGTASTTTPNASEDCRPLAICVKNLPLRSSDTSLKDGLFHEYKKHGKVRWVKVVGQSADRHAIVCFKKPEDVDKALEVSRDKLFFGCKIEVASYFVCETEDGDLRPYEAEIDEYHPKATRTLFIGNLEKDVTASELRKHFDRFGDIIEIDIKKQGAVSSYAFCQYSDISSVVKAIKEMDGEHLGNNRIKLGFGKSMPYNCVWIDGVNKFVTDKYLRIQFEPFGAVTRCIIDREKCQALVFYEQVLHAQQAVAKMRGFVLKNTKLQVDFASRECQECFFERLEKQGEIIDERREPTIRSFSTRYDPTVRPRTSSYSSRTSVNPIVVSAVPSPGTPGSVTPRGTSSRTRLPRFPYEYDPTEYERHFRSYDEYSQGSAASHDDSYDHEYPYSHDSPTHLDPLEVRVIQNIDANPFAPPDMRNLQKERVHLLEQLEECPSSGDEIMCPKKRLKLDLLDPSITSDVIIEANRDHRKVMEVRRLSVSDVTLRHHSRRPSIDSLKYKDLERVYLPHSVGCKRRKTAGSDNGSRSHHYEHSGSESIGGSRPGTPLCDEKPEFQPSEPRRVPREREGPLTLPLPRFAAQILRQGSVSVAGIKGQKDTNNILASPPPAATSPRISNPKPPSPVHVPPPASPPPRPPSLSSNSSDSDNGTPPSESLEERIRSLDEKYEKWSGSRALSISTSLDASLERFKFGHKLLNLNLKEVQPSEIVKSVMAKRSVFDEDLKRLENVGEKYEPKDFSLFPRANSLSALGSPAPQSPLPALPVSAPPLLKLAPVIQSPKTPTMLSPRSSGASLPAAKGLQYPFPSHPMPNPSASTPSPSTAPSPAPTHTDSRLKCASVPSNPSKISARSASTKCDKPSDSAKSKPGDTKCERVNTRRDSSGSNSSPRAGVSSRRNSDSAGKLQEESDRLEKEHERIEKERLEFERLDKERLERERVEKERLEKERIERLERERLERERIERERIDKERIEKERRDREKAEKEKQKLEKEKAEKARLDKELLEKERQERREKEEKERREKEERDRVEREREREVMREKELLEKQEKERKEREDKEKKDREEERKHREESHQERKKEDNSHKHRDNNVHKDDKSTSHENSHNKKENHSRHHDRDSDRRKESIKENRDNNIFDKHQKNSSENKNIRTITETRHMSIELDKNKHDSTKRKERNNSLPANISNKRRISSQDPLDSSDEAKKIKLSTSHEHKKISERRDSKDSSRSEDRSKNGKHKNNSVKSVDKYSSRDEEKRKEKEREERHKKHKLDKQKSKSKSREKETSEASNNTTNITSSTEFLAKLNLKSNEEIEKQKEKEKRRESHCSDEKRTVEDKDKIKKDKIISENKEIIKQHSRDDSLKNSEEKKKRDRIRKALNTSDSDSDEPKKHSIFDIVDDEPAYISMYDKVKARSCKNMQKQVEEKRQEKIKAKFSQLKQSRARREEKKRSTSWDEDSDTDKEGSEMKFRRKLIIDSSDESQERKIHKKRDVNTDSDCSVIRQIKSETSEDDFKNKHQTFKGCKSRIASDTSDDEYKNKMINNSSELFKNEEHLIKNEKQTSIKNELERLIKKERRNSKYQESEETTMHEMISEAESIEIKQEKFERQIFENTTDDEAAEMKKERSERREKKHKKKQKKQKHLMGDDVKNEVNESSHVDESDKNKYHDKKKEHIKKDKKKDKNKEGRDKSKKSKKSKSDVKNEKRDGKIETIFGSLSEDSETGNISVNNDKSSVVIHNDENVQRVYHSESEKETEIMIAQAREEHKKRKEKKRREKERRLLEAAALLPLDEDIPSNNSNDNSMDFADLGKQLEDNIKDDADANETKNNTENSSCNYVSHDNIKKEKDERKESREKKKKRKKNKDEKSKHHHHHHHHDKKPKSPEIRKEVTPKVEIKVETDDSVCHTPSQSLPNIFEPSDSKSSLDISISPSTRDVVQPISPIPKTPTSNKDKRKEPKLIPGFGSEIDEKLHESAIKSISEFEPVVKKEETIKEEVKEEKSVEIPEEKPRVVISISQEETEDAVAAILGESFGHQQFTECYSEDITTNTDSAPNISDENIVQDDEEMRQAVQSLSATDLDTKPDTPQSENDLQIDTDTEENDDVNVAFIGANKEAVNSKKESTEAVPIYNKTSISSPPSLTPIVKTTQSVNVESIKSEESGKSLPILPEQKQSAYPQIWTNDIKKITPDTTFVSVPTSVVIQTTTSAKTFTQNTIIKVDNKQNIEQSKIPLLPLQIAAPTNALHLHNLPARSPIQATKPPLQEPNVLSVKPTNIRLPLTSVMASKPLQATTMILPQSKVPLTNDATKIVETRPKMVIQTANLPQGAPRMMIRQVTPPGLLIPSRNLNQSAYGPFVHSNYNFSAVVKDESNLKAIHIPQKQNVIVPSMQSQGTVITSSGKSIIQSSCNTKMIFVASPNSSIKSSESINVGNNLGNSSGNIGGNSSGGTTVINCVVKGEKSQENNSIEDKNDEIKQTVDTVVVKEQINEVKKDEVVETNKLPIEKVTDELNVSLEKENDVSNKTKDDTVKEEPKQDIKDKEEPSKDDTTKKEKEEPTIKTDTTLESDISPKETDKFDEEKADTESIVSDISKERSTSADLTKEDLLGPQEDSDYWSAKEVNIDSVIKTLGSGDELSDHSSETGKDDWCDEDHIREGTPDKKQTDITLDSKLEDNILNDEGVEHEETKSETPTKRGMSRGGRRGGRGRGRGRGSVSSSERVGMQTRRGKLTKEQVATPTKRGRGGRVRNERKSSKESDSAPNDVYEFRDDSDDSNKEQRPRLVLTIKSSTASNTSNSHTTAIVKEITKDGAKEIGKETLVPQKEVNTVVNTALKVNENKEEFAPPQGNTRKSKRLQEKDVSKNTIDDTIEDVIKNTVQTRSGANQRRSTRQVINKQNSDTPRKSPRGRKPRNISETTENSSSEELSKDESQSPSKTNTDKDNIVNTVSVPQTVPVQQKEPSEKPKEQEKEALTNKVIQPATVKEKPYESLKAAMLRRIKGEMNASNNHEPTNLIDPVTGLLTPMRECEEGRYIPLPGSTAEQSKMSVSPKVEPAKITTVPEVPKTQTTVITQPTTVASTIIQQTAPKPQSLKAHVLSSQAAKAVVSQQYYSIAEFPSSQPSIVKAPSVPTLPVAKVPLTTLTQPINVSTTPISTISQHLSPRPNIGISVTSKPQVKPPVLSPQNIIVPTTPKQQFVVKQQIVPQQTIPKAHMNSVLSQVPYAKLPPSNIVNIVNIQVTKGAMKQQGPQPKFVPGVNSPPISKAVTVPSAGRVIQVPGKGVMEPPKVDVNLSPVVLGRPMLSPQGPQTRVGAPHYESSLHGETRAFMNCSRSPPPAHQNSPSPKGEPISHLPLRPPPQLNPPHYMLPSHMMQYQQFYRQQQLQHLQRTGIEKSVEEAEEAPVTSPPLELRRPGSVGLSARPTTVVPHGLHSPHDRTTEVYSPRLPPYHSRQYFDQTEPPPAHRPLTTTHASLAALGSHLSPLTTSERRTINPIPTTAHMGSTPHIERPLISAGIEKHVGAEVPPKMRGLQVATPPAQAVPAQAGSLFMLLKQYPLMWQGLLALKNDRAAVQMYSVSGNNEVARCSLPKNMDGSTPPLRIFQRMRLEPPQVEGVARKIQMESEHCILLALPCGHDPMDVLKQSMNLTNSFITYLQQKQAAGIINVAAPGTTQPPAYVVHIFPSCDFVNENLRRIAPNLLERVADVAHLLIVITTV